MLVAVTSEKMWEKFCDVIKRKDLFDDPRYDVNEKRVIKPRRVDPVA